MNYKVKVNGGVSIFHDLKLAEEFFFKIEKKYQENQANLIKLIKKLPITLI